MNDYYPFGMAMPGRSYAAADEYRYGFNGKERDKDMNSLTDYDYGFRIYNPAIGKFLSVDPLTKKYPWYTPYQFAGNKVIIAIDLDGGEEKFIINYYTDDQQGKPVLQNTYTRDVPTEDDLKGIIKSPTVINVYRRWKAVFPEGSSIANITLESYKVTRDENTGLTQGEELAKGSFDDKLAYYLYNGAMYIPGLGNLTKAGDDRDPMTGEYKLKGKRAGEAVEGILEFVTLGRSAVKGKLKSWLIGWLVDKGVEKAINITSEKTGFSKEQETVLGYHIAKMIWEAKEGDIKGLGEWLIKMTDIGVKGAVLVEKLKNEKGIDLNLPKNKNEAANKALQIENITGFSF